MHQFQAQSSYSPLRKLNPAMANRGLSHVGGGLSQSGLEQSEKNPVILPSNHHITVHVQHHHGKITHQGRHFAEGVIRENGLWIIGAKRCIGKVISNCVTCKKL